jgi:hypothetical protein
MTTAIWIVWGGVMLCLIWLNYDNYRILRIEKKLEGKANKRRSPKRCGVVTTGNGENEQYHCIYCGEEVPERGHLERKCKGAK